MHKKILRIISLALAILLLISVVPTPANAANKSEVNRINTQIRTLYRQTLYGTGRPSMLGFCATMVNWQLYLLGITTRVDANDGNTEYDYYCNQAYTTGGYRVRAYSASQYSLAGALNAITYNGTRDAYNILVGFQRTFTNSDGWRYGHALLIHAILDGVVYFSESYSTYLNGRYYYEGTPMACTIEQFAAYYAPWTLFEGVIHFGQKTYADSCDFYASYLYAQVGQDTVMYTAPCTPDVDARSREVRAVKSGERVTVTGLLRNTVGEYWYRVDDGQVGYIRAEAAQVLSMRYDDIQASNAAAPAVLLAGNTFALKGSVLSEFNEITSVRAQVFAGGDDSGYLMSASTMVGGYGYILSGSRLCNRLAFDKLDVGSYRYELAVVVGNSYFADGCLQTEWKTVKLWTSDFRVSNSVGESCSVTFDANGGNTTLNAMDVTLGDRLGTLPAATREGYLFRGWYTESGEAVTEGYVVTQDTKLYARWVSKSDLNGWYVVDGMWYYYVDGQRQTGFLEIDGIRYHLNENGYVDTGLVEVDGNHYYFHANGAMHHGWLTMDAGTYYFGVNGSAAIGWVRIDGEAFYFDENGILQEDASQIPGVKPDFVEDLQAQPC